MPGQKILWLCSWYPDRLQPFNGDFVQRHARAASFYNDIYVIHVTGDDLGNKQREEVINTASNLTEHICYFKKARFLWRYINYRRWRAAYHSAIKKYIDAKGLPDLVHVHVPFRDGMIATWFKKKYKIPYVITEHWTIYQPQNQVSFESQPRLFKSILSWITRHSTRLLPVSHDLGKLMNTLVGPKEFTVVENVADTSLFFYNPKPPDGLFRFIHVSTMGYQKNTGELIDCFVEFYKTNPQTQLILVGPAPANIKQQLASTGLHGKAIITKGEINYEQVAACLKESHAMVLFSRYENSPCSIIEALCCGMPVIATRVGGIPELINDTNGILVEPGNKEEMKAAFARMISEYQQFNRQEISQKAISRFDYQTIGKKLDNIYSIIINDRN